jgi:hypothetical protein
VRTVTTSPTTGRLPYDDPSPATEMTLDCRAVEAALALPRRRTPGERAARAVARPAPSLRYEDYPREVAKPSMAVSAAASRLGAAFHPDLD